MRHHQRTEPGAPGYVRLHGNPADASLPRASGFTLVELMVTLVVASILLGLGAASFTSVVQGSRLTSATNDLVSSIQLARSEATKRNARVIVCHSTDAGTATATCSGSAGTWESGWLVFADRDGNTSFDAGTDVLIRRRSGATSGVTIRANAVASTNLLFAPDGGIETTGADAEFRVCGKRGADVARQLLVKPVGRPEASVGASTCP